ncbi:Uncharacterised protein [Serratia plymuthica]|nr:Uncharacterised protein [Serratia plymuthica]
MTRAKVWRKKYQQPFTPLRHKRSAHQPTCGRHERSAHHAGHLRPLSGHVGGKVSDAGSFRHNLYSHIKGINQTDVTKAGSAAFTVNAHCGVPIGLNWKMRHVDAHEVTAAAIYRMQFPIIRWEAKSMFSAHIASTHREFSGGYSCLLCDLTTCFIYKTLIFKARKRPPRRPCSSSRQVNCRR